VARVVEFVGWENKHESLTTHFEILWNSTDRRFAFFVNAASQLRTTYFELCLLSFIEIFIQIGPRIR